MTTRASSVHPVLAANEAYNEWLRQGEVLAGRRDALAEQIMEARRADEKIQREHEAEVLQAVEAGQKIPEPPTPSEWQHLDTAMAVLQASERQHREGRTAVLVEAYRSGAWQGLEDREQSRLGRLRPIVDALDEILTEAQADGQVARTLVGALDQSEGKTVHPSRAERMPSRLTLQDVLDAAQQDRSLLAPVAMPRGVVREARIQPVMPDDEQTRVGHQPLGQQGGPQFGNVDTWPRVDVRSSRGAQL